MATKKPPLRLVEKPAATGPNPPSNLGEYGATLWRSVMAEYDIADTGGREMLRQACASLDRAEACATAIREDGEVVRTKTGPKAHPLLKEELANRSFVVRTLHRLGLDVEPVRAVGRPVGAH